MDSNDSYIWLSRKSYFELINSKFHKGYTISNFIEDFGIAIDCDRAFQRELLRFKIINKHKWCITRIKYGF